MTGMTAAIASLLADGALTFPLCAQQLGISVDELAERLRMMERQGYLMRQPAGEPEERPCSCSRCCATCCRQDRLPGPEVFSLTGKGRRLAAGP